MNNTKVTRRTVLAIVAISCALAVPRVQAQGRGGAPALTPTQQAALNAMPPIPQALTDAATTAAADLRTATFTEGQTAADRAAKLRALADAELALALARAEAFAVVQAALKPITPEQGAAFGPRAGGGGGRGGNLQPDTTDGYTSLFDGKTLTGWDGDPKYWRVQDGIIIAQSTPENPIVGGNTFLIWKGGNIKDFDLKVDYRFIGQGNSGVQIRSRMANPETRPWGISGLQMDMVTAGGGGSGVFYGEGGGISLIQNQGQAVHATPEGNRLIGSLGTGTADTFKPGPAAPDGPAGGWNTYHIIARQNVVAAFVNGRMTAFVVDDNRGVPTFAPEGLLALQMHTGGPFQIQFQNVYLRQITPELLTPLPAAAGAARGGGRGARAGAAPAPATAPAQ